MKKLFIMLVASFALMATSCGQKDNSKNENEETNAAAFMESQPLESGQYDASSYEITGDNARSGKFDGRMLVSLSPEQSAIYIYENGNRAKIDYLIMLEKPFEKGDSGVYKTSDNKGLPVIISTDSVYSITFDKTNAKIKIEFDKSPKSTGTALDILERINQMKTQK